MSRRMVPLPGLPLAIRDGDRLLAVPPMHTNTPSATRVLVFELVLRRQFGLAFDVAQAAEDARLGRESDVSRFTALMAQTPHKSTRGKAAA